MYIKLWPFKIKKLLHKGALHDSTAYLHDNIVYFKRANILS